MRGVGCRAQFGEWGVELCERTGMQSSVRGVRCRALREDWDAELCKGSGV